MKQDTRELGMVATVWVIAAIVVLALGRVDVPAGPIAGHDDGVPSARSIEATVPPVDDIRDPEHRGREQEHAVADRLPSAEAVPLIHLAADDKHLGSEPRAAVSPAEPASGHDAATDPRVAHASPEPEPEPQPAEAKPKPKPQPAEAKPKPKPQPAEAKPKPNEAKPKPKPQPAEAKPKPKPKPAEAKPKPKPKPAHGNAPDA